MRQPDTPGFGLLVRQPKKKSLSSWLVLLLGGALQAASLAWPVALPQSLAWLGLTQGQPLWWGQTLALASLVMLLPTCATWRIAALRGWIFATSWLACT